MDQLQRVDRSPLCFSSGLRASQDSFSGLNNDGAEMPTKMKTKDSLRRKRGRGKKKRGGGGGMWTTVTEEEGLGLCSPNMSGECMALTRTHTQYPPRHLSSRYTKAGRAPVFPVTWLFRRSFGHIDAFSRPLIVSVLLPRLKGRSTVFYLNP